MKILLVTEKFSPCNSQRDGGTRLVDTLRKGFGDCLKIMQFGGELNSLATWHYDYPLNSNDRFEKRLINSDFIADKIRTVEQQFTHIIFIHISMQFGFTDFREGIKIWTFPMFLTPSYLASGEHVSSEYTAREAITLLNSQNIITPSYLEKKQLIEFYSIPGQRVHVIPRGINTNLFPHKIRSFKQPLMFCSIGSIKPQKNTLGLIDLFVTIKDKFSGAQLDIIGPIQNQEYYILVKDKIDKLGLNKIVRLTGHIPADQLGYYISNHHIHLSTSKCETFGRSIFETLASGIPNVVLSENNAATEFLYNLPYIKFVNDNREALYAIAEIFNNLPVLSALSLEINKLYDDEILTSLIIAKICDKPAIAISDFDGTLFHKNEAERTNKSIAEFQEFNNRVICSARSLSDLLQELKKYNLKVEWIIAYSGAVIADGLGNIILITPIDARDISKLEKLPDIQKIKIKGKVIQVVIPVDKLPSIFGMHIEIYQDTAYLSHWQSSKLRAIHRLLNHINWQGTVKAFGDGKYDREFLTYFDGKLIK